MKMGILGGTFNPIHNGHLVLSEYIREKLQLDKIIFIPTGISPHKDESNVLNKHHREQMIRLAISSNQNFSISSIETERQGKSYTIDTINLLKKLYPYDELYMILGEDSLLELSKWKDYKRIISSTNIIVMDRYLENDNTLAKRINKYNIRYNGNISRVKTPLIEVSSTEIRRRVKSNQSIKYLLPEEVEEYIYNNKLYK